MSDAASIGELEARLWKELTPMAFAFVGLTGNDNRDVPMTLHREPDDGQRAWIFTTTNGVLASGGSASARYVSKHQNFFARIDGKLLCETDDATINRLWSPRIEAWYSGGRQDPSLCVMRFEISGAELWSGELSPWSFIKMMVGADVHADLDDQHATVG
jgi:general stress protein 26